MAGAEAESPPEEDTVVDGADDGAEEQRAPKVLRSPKSPTVEEIEEHEASEHVAYRTWCGHCVRARGLRERHARIPEEEIAQRSFPVIGIDYFWNGKSDKEREHELPSLQVKDERSGVTWAEDMDAPVRIDLPEATGKLSPEPAKKDFVARHLCVTRKDVQDALR